MAYLTGRDTPLPVILKEIPTLEYKTLKRAVVTAHRLKHRGVVPVQCCFVDAKRDVVVLHSRFYSGGNMRIWLQGKSPAALLRAAHRISEAVAVLHLHGTLHRDIKPENIGESFLSHEQLSVSARVSARTDSVFRVG